MAAASMKSATDPYAALRRMRFDEQVVEPSYGVTGYAGQQEQYGEIPGATYYTPAGGWNAPALKPFQSKYSDSSGATAIGPDGKLRMTLQQPGMHKYDTMDVVYAKDPQTGEWVMEGDPTPTRQISGVEKFRDSLEQKILPLAATVLGAGYGAEALGGAMSGGEAALAASGPEAFGLAAQTGLGDAAAATGAAGSVGSTVAEQIALMEANGMTAAEISAATGGTVPGFTAADIASMSAATGSAGSSAIPTAAEAAKAVGPTVAKEVIPAAAKGAMDAKNWIDLAGLGAGLYLANEASNNASSATDKAKEVADGSLELSREALDWYKQTYADQAPARDAAAKRAQEVSDAQLAALNFATDQSKELDTYNKSTFRPLEQRMVQEAATYDTPQRRMAAAASAAADVDMSTAAARQAMERNQARAGVLPGSGKAMALAEDSAVAQGRNRGSAMTTAVRNVEGQGYARMADAVGLGRGLAPIQATQQQIATSTGNSAANNATTALNATQSGNPLMASGYTSTLNARNSAGNLYDAVARTQVAEDRTLLDGISGLGNFLGKTYGSDKKIKKGTGRMADSAKALKQVEATPVHEGWQYDPAKGGPDDGGKKHTGPMAQDVRSTMGEAAAPGGKVIDIATINGRMLAAVKELSKRVKKLEREDQNEKEAA